MLCKNCGSEIKTGQSLCPACGQSIENPPPQKPHKTPLWIKLIAAIAIIGALASLANLFLTENAEEVVENQLDAIRSNKLTEAYFEYTSRQFQNETSLEAFKEFIKPLLPLINHASSKGKEYSLEDGIKRVRETFTTPDHQTIIIDFELAKEEEDWKILNIKLVSAEDGSRESRIDNEAVTPIVKQLETLKEHQIDKAYQTFATRDFKKATSLQAFQNFIQAAPFFLNYTSYDILNLAYQDGYALAKVVFREKSAQITVLYTLAVEEHLWKIQGMEIAHGDEVQESASGFNTEDLLEVIKKQLEEIKKGDIKKAYRDYTSKDFQEATSYEDFESFVKAFPIFVDNKASNFEKLTFNDNIAVFNVQLTSSGDDKRDVDYYLVREDGLWKILQIHVYEKNSSKQNGKSNGTSSVGA